ncbi:hypothetical protein BHE74_00019708 [Ensete ventricosum]|nr:hypothetical protein BHE74_00019708 [Ensete ventricosum]
MIFCALSQKFKILAIPKVLALENSYENGFMKKHIGKKLCTKSRFNWFFCTPSKKFKIPAIPNVLAHRKSYEKNAMVIYIAQSRGLIDFSHTISKIQNIGHSQRISSWEVM